MFFGLAILSGVLTALAFPKFDLFFLAWVSLIPLLFALRRKRASRPFLLGFAAGFAYYAILLYWIPDVPAHYGNLAPALSFLIYLILVGFMALSWGLFGLLLARIGSAFPSTALLLAPFLWISLEYIWTFFLTGFPWGLLGYSQVKNIAFLQFASMAGVYGLSFALVLLQSMFVLSMLTKRRSPFFLALSIVLLIHGAGVWTLRTSPPPADTFRAAVIQGNVSSDVYWNQVSTEMVEGLFERHIKLSQEAFRAGAGLVIWPEFTVPLCFSCDEPVYNSMKQRLCRFVEETRATLLVGTNETAVRDGELLYYNTAMCLHPDLSTTEYYKMHLVPFGEYTPYKGVFSFIEKITHAIGDITPGKTHVLHSFEGHPFGSPICYEIIFPRLVRRFVERGAQFLVTITNDGWYGKTSAPRQHFLIAVFRAVENRRYLLRAATTGVSGIVDPYGRILARSQLMTETFLTGNIEPLRGLSVYTRLGDVLPVAGLTLGGIFFILSLIKVANERKKPGRRGKIV
jgi:apolipoprotein N-acyltransferase